MFVVVYRPPGPYSEFLSEFSGYTISEANVPAELKTVDVQQPLFIPLF